MKIIKYDNSVLQYILESFIESFPEWKLDDAKNYLMQAYINNPEFCFMALNENEEFLGAIFCKISPSKSGKVLIVESIQVIKKYRNTGVGRSLLKQVINESYKNNILNISMLAPTKNDFPLSWYKKIGFEESSWIELITSTDKIKNI